MHLRFTLPLTTFLSIISSLHGVISLPASSTSPTGTAPSPATIAEKGTAVPIVPLSEQSTTTLGSPLSFGPESTTTLGSPLSFGPESTTTLGSPLSFGPESTTTLGSPLSYGPESTTIPVQATRNSSVPIAAALNPTASAHDQGHPSANIDFGSHYGWVGVYSDAQCNGDPIDARGRPKINDQACRKLTAGNGDSLGISWGTWPLGFSNLGLYDDDNCTSLVKQIADGDEKGGPGACLTVRSVGSIMNLDNKQ